jgi:flagellar basal body-associated protein FliL
MKNPPQGRQRLIILAMLLVLAAVSAEAVVFVHFDHHDHDCSGGECPVCLYMQIVRNVFESLGRCGVIAFLTGIVPFKIIVKIHLLFRVSGATPVALKVKSTT